MSEQDLSGDVNYWQCPGVIVGGPAMGEWLIGDVSVLGVYVRVRVLSELGVSGNEIGTRET